MRLPITVISVLLPTLTLAGVVAVESITIKAIGTDAPGPGAATTKVSVSSITDVETAVLGGASTKVSVTGITGIENITAEATTATSAVSASSPTIATRAGCSTGQVIVNPSFYGLPPNFAPDISPWTIRNEDGSPGCTYITNSYAESDHDEFYGDGRLIKCDFPASGGQDIISQTISNMCPGHTYKLTLHVACDYFDTNDTVLYTDFRADFNGVCAIQPQCACTACDPSKQVCNRPYYHAVSANVTAPDSGTAALQIYVDQWPTDYAVLPMVLDLVYLTGVGYDGSLLNPSP